MVFFPILNLDRVQMKRQADVEFRTGPNGRFLNDDHRGMAPLCFI